MALEFISDSSLRINHSAECKTQVITNILNLSYMKLPENMSKIVGKTYKGQKDDEGRPHGHGIMEFFTRTDKKYKYEGHFEHGMRSGYGVWHESMQFIREYEPWEWAQMGDYDSAGRLIHPNTKPGPRREVVNCWDEKFRGWWKNDDAVHSMKGKTYAEWSLDQVEDEKFLDHFIDFKAVRKLPKTIISKLIISDNIYSRFAYGVWMWSYLKDSESLKKAFAIFDESARAGIADAIQMMSRMYYLGEAYDEKAGKFVMDRALSKELNEQAVEKGSLLARLRRNRNQFYGATGFQTDRSSALAEAESEASRYNGSIHWTEQLGWYYEAEGETEKAIKAYEKCIINGYYAPIYDLALMYIENGDEGYYQTLMKLGMQLGVPDCRILGMENECRWESLSGDERLDIYRQLKRNLPEGIEHGSGVCAYILADALLNGKFGYDMELRKGREYADLALTFGFNPGASLVIEAAETLNDPEFISDDDLLRLRYDALRYGIEEQLDYVIRNKDIYIEMGYGDDIEKVWMPMWKKNHPEAKTQISPSVIIIQPSGAACVVEADVFAMSYREMRQLIDAEGLDAVHFSEPLSQITKTCGFRGYQIAMYVDRDGYAKDLPDNVAGTLLYGTGAEIRGAVIIALEDNKYDTHSFHFQEDLDNVLAEISDLARGLVRRIS